MHIGRQLGVAMCYLTNVICVLMWKSEVNTSERICQACLVRLTVISNTVMQYLLTILLFGRHSISKLTHFIGSPLALNVISQYTHAHEPPSILPGLHAQQATTMLIQTERTKAHCLVCTRYTLSK